MIIKEITFKKRGYCHMAANTIYVVHDEQLVEIATIRPEFPEIAGLFLEFLKVNDDKHDYRMMENDNIDQ